jgi:rhombotail lipoprotein
VDEPSIPQQMLPLRVGISFVPGEKMYGSTLTELKKMELMKLIGEHFKTYPYIKRTVLWTLSQIGIALLIVAASYFSLAPLKKAKAVQG